MKHTLITMFISQNAHKHKQRRSLPLEHELRHLTFSFFPENLDVLKCMLTFGGIWTIKCCEYSKCIYIDMSTQVMPGPWFCLKFWIMGYSEGEGCELEFLVPTMHCVVWLFSTLRFFYFSVETSVFVSCRRPLKVWDGN